MRTEFDLDQTPGNGDIRSTGIVRPVRNGVSLMNNTLPVELTKDERALLLRGLRFVRSSVMLDIHDPDPNESADRDGQLKAITALVEQLNGSRPAGATAGV